MKKKNFSPTSEAWNNDDDSDRETKKKKKKDTRQQNDNQTKWSGNHGGRRHGRNHRGGGGNTKSPSKEDTTRLIPNRSWKYENKLTKHPYSRDPMDYNIELSQQDEYDINRLITLRTKARSRSDYKMADTYLKQLEYGYGIQIYDDERIWKIARHSHPKRKHPYLYLRQQQDTTPNNNSKSSDKLSSSQYVISEQKIHDEFTKRWKLRQELHELNKSLSNRSSSSSDGGLGKQRQQLRSTIHQQTHRLESLGIWLNDATMQWRRRDNGDENDTTPSFYPEDEYNEDLELDHDDDDDDYESILQQQHRPKHLTYLPSIHSEPISNLDDAFCIEALVESQHQLKRQQKQNSLSTKEQIQKVIHKLLRDYNVFVYNDTMEWSKGNYRRKGNKQTLQPYKRSKSSHRVFDINVVQELVKERQYLIVVEQNYIRAKYLTKKLWTEHLVQVQDETQTWYATNPDDDDAMKDGEQNVLRMIGNDAKFYIPNSSEKKTQEGEEEEGSTAPTTMTTVYKRASADIDKTITSREELQRITYLVEERHKARMLKKYDVADSLLKELWDKHDGIQVNDELKLWSKSGIFDSDDLKKPYTQSLFSDPTDFGKDIETLVHRRLLYKLRRDWKKVNHMDEQLWFGYRVKVNDTKRQWTVVAAGINNDPIFSNEPYIMSSKSLSLPASGNDDDQDDKKKTTTIIQALVNQRMFFQDVEKDHEKLKKLTKRLKEEYNVTVHDELRMWSIGGEFPSLSEIRKEEEARKMKHAKRDHHHEQPQQLRPSTTKSTTTTTTTLPPSSTNNDEKKQHRPSSKPTFDESIKYTQSPYSKPLHAGDDVEEIELLVQERFHAMSNDEYNLSEKLVGIDNIAQELELELERRFQIKVHDELRQWSKGGQFYDDDGSSKEVDDAIPETMMAAAAMEETTTATEPVAVQSNNDNDAMSKVVDSPTDISSLEIPTYSQSEYSLPLDEEEDDYDETLEEIQELIEARWFAMSPHATREERFAEELEKELQERFYVYVHDEYQEWSIGGRFHQYDEIKPPRNEEDEELLDFLAAQIEEQEDQEKQADQEEEEEEEEKVRS